MNPAERVNSIILNAARKAYVHDDRGDEDCPDCGVRWADTLRGCPGCGVTISEIAERLTKGAA